MPNFIKSVRASIVGPKFGSRSSIPVNIFIISVFNLFYKPNFLKIKHVAIMRPNYAQVFNFRSRCAIANIIFMINKFDLL